MLSNICMGHFVLECLDPHHVPAPPEPLVVAICHELSVIRAEMAST